MQVRNIFPNRKRKSGFFIETGGLGKARIVIPDLFLIFAESDTRKAGGPMKFKSYIIFFLLFGVLADIYLTLVLWPEMPAGWKWVLCLPTLACGACLPLIGMGRHYTDAVRVFSYLTFIFALPKFILSLFSAIGRYLLQLPHGVADGIALAFGGSASLFFLFLIFFATRHLQVNLMELSFKDLPKAFDGLRICQLSDFHLGSFGKRSRYIQRIIDTAVSLKPDLILFTGDLVNFESSEAVPYLNLLARLHAPLGIFSVRGNHDYLLHGHHDEQERQRDMDHVLEMERGLGWNVLLNAHALIRRGQDALALVGVENVSKNPYFEQTGGDLKQALQGLPEGIFKILLTHDPSHWRSEVVPAGGIALTLSGHTHGLKYKMAGLHPSHWRLPESGGLYTEGGQTLHVSVGLGSAFAFRLGGFPQVDILTLKCTNT